MALYTHKLTPAELALRIFLIIGVVAAIGIPYQLRDKTPPAIYGPVAKSYQSEIISGLHKVGANIQGRFCVQTNKRRLKVWCRSTQTTPAIVARYFITTGWHTVTETSATPIELVNSGRRMKIETLDEVVSVSIEEEITSPTSAPMIVR